MTIECIGSPFTYRWPTGEVRLEPGKPVDLPDALAKRLLDKAPDKVRVITTVRMGARSSALSIRSTSTRTGLAGRL